MSLLVGLPLGIFRLLWTLALLALRLAVPIVGIVLILWVLRRVRPGGPPPQKPKEPEFDGPVVTVDYEEVPEPPESSEQGENQK